MLASRCVPLKVAVGCLQSAGHLSAQPPHLLLRALSARAPRPSDESGHPQHPQQPQQPQGRRKGSAGRGSGRGGGGGGSAEQGAVALQVSRESFLAAFANHFDAMAAQFEQEGFAPFREAYMQHWLHSGQEVTVKGRDGEPDAKMRIEGLTNSGALRTVDVISGEAFELYPDGNSFDFFQGLIKQKL